MDTSIIELPAFEDKRGNLVFLESLRHIPFLVKRLYYIYGVPEGESRAAHGHKILKQFFIPIAGSFTITLDDAQEKKEYRMDSPNKGLYVGPGLWRDLTSFAVDTVCLVLASEYYSEDDYIRDYARFKEYKSES